MLNKHILVLIGFAGVMAWADGALAAKLGHPGTSVKGSTTAQNQVNLLSDPPSDGSGTITSLYNQNPAQGDVLSIADVWAEPGFAIRSVTVQTTAGYDSFSYAPAKTTEIPISLPQGDIEAGAVQVMYVSDLANGSPMTVNDGTDNNGQTILGDLTHEVIFNLTALGLADEASQTPADPFMVMLADQPSAGTGDPDTGDNPIGDFPTPDSYTTPDGTTYSGPASDSNPNGIDGSSDTFRVAVNIPEPASCSLLAVGSGILLRRHRVRI